MVDNDKEIVQLLKKTLVLLRAAYIPEIRSRMESLLDTDAKKIAYHNSDDKSSQEVEKLSGIKYVQVTELWREWFQNGLGYMKSVKGGKRFIRDISLEDVGIPLP
ncbi:MAG: hypothetical protein ACXAAQ_15180 [Candidatus Thorarchaeota archaeon]